MNLKLIINFLILTSISANFIPSINESSLNLSRNRRKDDAKLESIELIQEALDYFTGLKILKDFLGMGKLIYKIQDYLFSSETEENEEIIRLNKKLDEISFDMKDLKSTVKCSFSEQNYRNDLYVKSKRLLDLIKAYSDQDHKLTAKIQIADVCRDNTEGIDKILASLRFYMELDEVSKVFKQCCHYKSDCINEWYYKIKRFSLLFIYLVRGCENAASLKTDFDYDLFLEEIEKSTEYYTKNFLLSQFVNDEEEFGLKNTVITNFKKNYNANQTAEILKRNYEFFDWKIIHFKDFTRKRNLISSDNKYCGSYVTEDFAGIKKKLLLVSWCIKSLVTSSNYNLEILSSYKGPNKIEIDHEFNLIKDKYSSRVNFILCTNFLNSNDIDSYGDFVFKYTMHQYFFSHEFLICFMSESLQTEPILPSESRFSNLRVLFIPNSRNSNKNNLREVRYDNIRLLGNKIEIFYKQFYEYTAKSCWNQCKKDKNCLASSFATDLARRFPLNKESEIKSEKVCTLYDKFDPNFIYKKKNWITYAKSGRYNFSLKT